MIEIPLGAKDSEMEGFEYRIPKGYEGVIEDGVFRLKKADSEYEATRKIIVERMKKWRCEAAANCCSADIMAANRALDWLENRRSAMQPKWLYRLEYRDSSCGLWYDGGGKWCFDSGIGSLDDSCKTKTLPMDYDERYKQNGRDWFSSCSKKEDLLHWYSKEDARKLLDKGFVFTRYLATEYHEYDQQTVFIKETALFREEIDFFSLMGEQKPAEWSEEDEAMLVNVFGTYKTLEDMLNLSTGQDSDILESMNFERDWLKDRFKSLRPQPKVEWSEEDEVMLNRIEYRLKDWDNIKAQHGYQDDYNLPSPIKWLKSLRPQPHWKPSEEQMDELHNAVSLIATPNKFILESLYNDLKKL